MTTTTLRRPVLRFDEETHRYYLDEVLIPGTTGILADNGFIDTEFYTEEGRIRGTRVHLLCQFFDEGRYDASEAERFGLAGYVESWRKLKARLSMEMVGIEELLAHPVYRFGGRPDRLVKIRGRLWVIDQKTGGREKWHRLQLGSYEQLYLANGTVGPICRGGAYLKADGSIADFIEYSDMNDGLNFLSLVAATHLRAEYGVKRSHE